MSLDNIRIVLVNTKHTGNIGAVARAMKNMGLVDLRLVDPKNALDRQAYERAAGAVDVLDKAVICASIDEAVADCSLVVGTSARGRRIPWPLLPPRECAARAVGEASTARVALLFGREDRGLTNEELQRCNLHLHIPTDDEYSSLNLAMAVQVICYELRLAWLDAVAGNTADSNNSDINADPMAQWDIDFATADELERFFVHLEQTLTDLGFLKPRAPKQLMTRLRRLFTRTRLDEMEISILRGVLTAAQSWVDKSRGKSTDP